MRGLCAILLTLIPLLGWSSLSDTILLEHSNLEYKQFNKKSYNSILNEVSDSFISFNHKAYLSFGFNNYSFDYQATMQIDKWFELGAGIGFHRNTVVFFSASDRHKMGVNSLPTYITAIVYPYHDDNRAYYLKGNYGFSNNLSGKKNRNDKSIQANVLQYGIGYKALNIASGRLMFVEVSYYSSVAKGAFKDSETYNAAIDYDLKFNALVLSLGININR